MAETVLQLLSRRVVRMVRCRGGSSGRSQPARQGGELRTRVAVPRTQQAQRPDENKGKISSTNYRSVEKNYRTVCLFVMSLGLGVVPIPTHTPRVGKTPHGTVISPNRHGNQGNSLHGQTLEGKIMNIDKGNANVLGLSRGSKLVTRLTEFTKILYGQNSNIIRASLPS